MEERRKSVRVYIGNRLGYWLLGKEKKIGPFRLTSISGGGLSFLTDKVLLEGEPLEVELRLPPEVKRISSKAQVVRSEPLLRKNLFEVGAKFIGLPDRERDVVFRFVSDRLKAERKKIMEAYS